MFLQNLAKIRPFHLLKRRKRFWAWALELLPIIVGGLIAVLVVLILVTAFDSSGTVARFLGGNILGIALGDKREVLTFLGLTTAGLVLIAQALVNNRRAKGVEETAKAQQQTVQAQLSSSLQTLLDTALAKLGDTAASVRLGSIYALYHFALDNSERAQSTVEILCAHLRETTHNKKYQEEHTERPSNEVQSLLDLLCKPGQWQALQNHLPEDGRSGFIRDFGFCYLRRANLEDACLRRVNLTNADLQDANFFGASLQGANLFRANLQGANLSNANLQGAHLSDANLQIAHLIYANLQGAGLSNANLQGAAPFRANLQGANLFRANLQGANLSHANLQGAHLSHANLQGANLFRANLQGAFTGGIRIRYLFEEQIRDRIGKETDLQTTVFAGVLNQENCDQILADLYVAGVPGIWLKNVAERLKPHVDQPPSYEVPEEAITGVLTKEKAEEIIAEYQEAMKDVP